jgi:hypothetical protein
VKQLIPAGTGGQIYVLTLALVNNWWSDCELIVAENTRKDAEKVLALKRRGDGLGKTPAGGQPIGRDDGEDHAAALQLVAETILPALTRLDPTRSDDADGGQPLQIGQ